MSKIEKKLKNLKTDLDHLEVPLELEQRLNRALEDKVKRKQNIWGKVIALFLVCLLVGYNFDTLAYYSKQIIGYNDVMDGTLRELNELGKGQIINKSYSLKNGASLTLDGIMMDETQLIIFYTVNDPNGNIEDIFPRFELKGILGEYFSQHGRGESNEERTEMKAMQNFEPPYFFEKTLRLSFTINNQGEVEQGEFTIKIDRDKAMTHTLKASINKSIEVDEEIINFNSILASPTRTVIKGTIQNILELAIDQLSGERIRPKRLDIKLFANGKEVNQQSGGISTDNKGITFHKEYDTLPEHLESLELELVSFAADHDVNEIVDLSEEEEQKVMVKGQEIIINKVFESNGNTCVTITTEEETILTKVMLLVDGERVNLNRTFNDDYTKLKGGKILHIRTLEFNELGDNYKLDIKRMTYAKEYNEVIEIPVK